MILLHFHLFLPFLLFSSFSTAEDYFINCGTSTKTATSTGQSFTGDEVPHAVRFTRHKSYTVSSLVPPEPLYQTARVFSNPSAYDFNIRQIGIYFVRLHFCAFSSSLSGNKFNVSASDHMLLTDFSLAVNNNSKNCSSNTKEFILNITNEKFKIQFVPTSSSIAFVNAIEIVFSENLNITEVTGRHHVSPAGSLGNYSGQKSNFYETKYRINVGGKEINGSNSTLWRSWMTDDQYLINKGDAMNKSKQTIDYGRSQITTDYAPLDVYRTAKVLKNSAGSPVSPPNLTWQFSVNTENRYFIRVHFCDILSLSLANYVFNLYIFSNFRDVIDLNNYGQTPFYNDYVVESDRLGFINISVGPNATSSDQRLFFLNGLEIMQINNETASELSEKNDDHVLIIVGSSAAVLIAVIFAAVFVCLHRRNKIRKKAEAFEWGNLPMYGAASSHNKGSVGSNSRTSTYQNLQLGLQIPFVEIQRVTKNFDPSLIIGEGGFGKVYKGTLKTGMKVAVKRGSPDHGQGIAEFQTEIMILSKIIHRHLVSLIGYCCENGEMILVYEFMEKGTLRHHLYDSNKSLSSTTHEGLSWNQRLKICIEAAKGIQYLHTGTDKGIIHRDVKSTNILLDENYVAKVADFGLSRSGYLDQTHVSISDVKGTLGYLDPEYIICLQLTEKSDVYAFGVVLFEVLCARPVINQSLPRDQISLPDWATACFENGSIETIIDPMIADEINISSLNKFCEIAQKCLKKDAADRPPMSDVCWGLEYALHLQKAATEKVLQDDSTTDVSLNMSFPAIRRFPSQTITDIECDTDISNTGTGEVFSQLAINGGTGK